MHNIHKTAIIEEGTRLGENITIGPYCVIGKDVKVGNGTTIGSHTVIEGKTIIGENNQIFSHVTLGSIPQDLKFAGEDVELIIGNNNKIREYTLFNPGTKGGGTITKIGDNNLFMAYTHIAHDVIIGNHCIFANVATLAGHVEIDDYAVIGGLVGIHQFCKIGSNVMVSVGSVVTQDIPPFCLAEGNRAVLRGLNLNGLRRRLKNRADIDAIKKSYKAIFESKKPIIDTAKELLETNDNQYVKQLANFVVNTKRGIYFNRK